MQFFGASSAGTRAVSGHGIHSDATGVLEELGGDASNFAARQLTAKITAGADLILTMTKAHTDRVLELVPQRLPRTFTLIEASRLVTQWEAETIEDLSALRPHLVGTSDSDITDPIGQSPEVFKTVGAQIANLLPPVLELCRRSRSG